MTNEQNKAVARRFLDAAVAGDPANFKDLLSPDFVAHLATGPCLTN